MTDVSRRASNVDRDDQPTMRGRLGGPKVVLGVFGLMFSLTLAAIVAPTLVLRADQKSLDIYGEVPAFHLQDQTGADFTDSELRGKVIVANFMFTRCPTVCPVLSMKMRRVQQRTTDMASEIKLISFSVDPAHDTPEVLAAYAKKHRADPGRWRFLTGDAKSIQAIASEGFALALDRVGVQTSGVPDIVHAEHFVLLDRSGRIRGYYDSNEATRVERMLRDARRLAIRTE
ncbi:MAG: SCO family protein [Proteobacteria bacterium]|nr:SCO family protein [Pseudomonadota bacterium]